MYNEMHSFKNTKNLLIFYPDCRRLQSSCDFDEANKCEVSVSALVPDAHIQMLCMCQETCRQYSPTNTGFLWLILKFGILNIRFVGIRLMTKKSHRGQCCVLFIRL